jgi:hypothetical protein
MQYRFVQAYGDTVQEWDAMVAEVDSALRDVTMLDRRLRRTIREERRKLLRKARRARRAAKEAFLEA